MGTTIQILLLVVLLCGAFLLYSLRKIRKLPCSNSSPRDKIKESLLYKHVEYLSEKIGSRSVFEYDRLTAAKEYILSCLASMGYIPSVQDFSYQGRIFSNIILSIPGKSRAGDIVVFGAHYDTVIGTPGADDNASAVAILLEMCRHLRDYVPERTLRLVFFTLEEPPAFLSSCMGSRVYAQECSRQKENIQAMVSLEMLGYYSDQKGAQGFPFPLMSLMYPSTPNFIAVVGNLSSRGIVKKVARSMRKTGTIPVETLTTFGFVPGVDFSDHKSFWKMGYHALMITDTAFYRNPNYHSDKDRIATLDFDRLSCLLPALVQMAKDLTSSPPLPLGEGRGEGKQAWGSVERRPHASSNSHHRASQTTSVMFKTS